MAISSSRATSAQPRDPVELTEPVLGPREESPGRRKLSVVVPLLNEEGTDRIQQFMHERLIDGFATLEEARDAIAAHLRARGG